MKRGLQYDEGKRVIVSGEMLRGWLVLRSALRRGGGSLTSRPADDTTRQGGDQARRPQTRFSSSAANHPSSKEREGKKNSLASVFEPQTDTGRLVLRRPLHGVHGERCSLAVARDRVPVPAVFFLLPF